MALPLFHFATRFNSKNLCMKLSFRLNSKTYICILKTKFREKENLNCKFT